MLEEEEYVVVVNVCGGVVEEGEEMSYAPISIVAWVAVVEARLCSEF